VRVSCNRVVRIDEIKLFGKNGQGPRDNSDGCLTVFNNGFCLNKKRPVWAFFIYSPFSTCSKVFQIFANPRSAISPKPWYCWAICMAALGLISNFPLCLFSAIFPVPYWGIHLQYRFEAEKLVLKGFHQDL
jgi:hypothetical protein